MCLMWRERARETLARTDRDTARLHSRLGAWEGDWRGVGEEGTGCAYPAPARISAMADHHRAHDLNLAHWAALGPRPPNKRTRPVKKCDTLEEYLLTPSNRIGVYFLSLPHPRFWGHAEKSFCPFLAPRSPHDSASTSKDIPEPQVSPQFVNGTPQGTTWAV